MTKPHPRRLIIAGGMLMAGFAVILITTGGPTEPAHGGKKLSAWLDELNAMTFPGECDPNTRPAQAVRAIGTDAIPWLLDELGIEGSALKTRLNQLLVRQSFIKFRFEDSHIRLRRAVMGFAALGPIAKPAIPSLLKLVEKNPGYAPTALAYVGPPAIPALQQCLTNYHSYNSSVGRIVPIPGNTIPAIFNAIQAGRLSNSHAAIFLPAVKAWAQSTNKNPALYDGTRMFLQHFDSTNATPKE
jgi:hypothetical protein